MLNHPFLYKDFQPAESENFKLLRAQGLKWIEQLAREQWTDYNSHDPGITLLEALCYAITDLGYRTQFEVKDLLTRSERGVRYTVARFHTAAEVMSCYPVSFDDLRKVLIDIRGVRNAWIYPVETAAYQAEGCELRSIPPEDASASNAFILKGLYEVCIEYDEFLKEMRLGVPDLSCVGASQGRYLRPAGQGICFEIEQDIVLRSVAVYAADPDPAEQQDEAGKTVQLPGAPVPIRLLLSDGEGNLLRSWEHWIPLPHVKTVLELDHSFEYDAYRCREGGQANRYCLRAEGPEGCLWLFAHEEAGFPFRLPGYVSLTGGSPDPDWNYFFYDWEWDSHPAEDSLGKWQRGRAGEPDDSNYLSEYISPAGEAIVFDAERAFVLDALHVFVNRPGPVSIELQNAQGEVIRSETFHIPQTLCKKRLPLCWEIPACQNYRLSARAGEGVELALNQGAAFPYAVPGVLLLLGGWQGGRLEQVYPFLYDWEISWRQPEHGELDDHELTKGRVRREVWQRLHQLRNLCEDPVRISEVQEEEVGIDADIHLRAGADVNEVHAEILCRLEAHIKPPVHFYTLSQMMERGYTTDHIFTGPLLEHGFIDPAEFAAAADRTELRASDVINLLMDIPGIEAVKRLRLQTYRRGVLYKEDPWFLCLADGSCWKPNFAPGRSCFSFLHKRVTLRSERREVAALLEEKRLATRPVKLKGQQRDRPVPLGEDREVGAFWPMQQDLPAVYRAGRFEVPASQPVQRKAQSLQLKAYLMFFEQMLANYLAQLEQMHRLFSWERVSPLQTYFTQLATEGIAEAEKLYLDYPRLRADLARVIEAPMEALERRKRFLDHLAARFAERFTDYSLLMFQLFDGKAAALEKVIRDQELFLEHYPTLSRERARAFDYRSSARLLGGYQRRVMALLGMHPRQPGELPPPAGYRLQREEGKGWRFAVEDSEGNLLFSSRFVSLESKVAGLFGIFLMQGGSAENYQLRTWQEEDCEYAAWQLAGPCAGEAQQPIGATPAGGEAALQRVMEWVRAYVPPAPAPAAFTDAWPDLANDYFEIAEDAGGWRFEVREGDVLLFRSEACRRREAAEQVLDAAIRLGSRREAWRLDPEACRWALVNDCGEDREAEVLGHTASLEALGRVMDLLAQAESAEGMHVLEHILLRPRTQEDVVFQQIPGYAGARSHPVGPDLYSLQATVLLPAWPRRSGSLAFRRLAEDLLRAEAPAHAYLHVVWVSYAQMRRFERAWNAWLAQLGRLPLSVNGLPPLPARGPEGWSASLEALIRSVECLRSQYPPARLQGSAPAGGEAPTLGQMSLSAM